ncbi:MAG: alkaline phosphatase family protein [Theionarchaea archaeon]|nr:alkaline phosphatase family protein [Theionarchaea archaeon]
MKKRSVLIGIDGVPYNLMDDLSTSGVMPYFQELKEEGQFQKMCSSIPEISSVSWSSIITGKNPGEHSIYGFTELLPNSYTVSFPHFGKLKANPFWKRDGVFSVINVPSTYPAAEINGFLVSGFISPDLEKAVYPPRYSEVLKNFKYRIDVDTKKARKSPTLLFKELYETLESRVKVYKYFWEKLDWDVFMFVITGSDRLGHFLWNAYGDETHEYHTQFLEFFRRVDRCIQDIGENIKKNDSLFILSDHGMEQIQVSVNINCYLEDKGFLKRGRDSRKGYNNIKEGTRAFALDPARIYINRKKLYPEGCISPEEEENLLEELEEVFQNLERNGQKVIKAIYRKDQIYHGAYVDQAPDLVLLPDKGFNLKGGILPEKIFEIDELSGKHTQDAFLYTSDVRITNPSVEDVVPLLNQCMRW